MKKFSLIFSQLVLLLMLVIMSIAPVSAKVASGLQELGGGLSQGQALLESTARLGSGVFSYDDMSGSSLVPKGAGPAISKQKQAGHIPGTPQNANRLKQGKPTSSFFGEKSGERLTQQAFEKGKPVSGRPNVREHDFGVSTGTGPNGGMQTRVRVHQDSKGRIHGHPSGPERF